MEACFSDFCTRRSFPFASRLRISRLRICLQSCYLACTHPSSRAPRLAFSVTPSSTTPLGLALGPDLPRADEPSSGNLGFSVRGILTLVPLLTPAFSLPYAPPLLSVRLLRSWNAPLPSLGIRSFGSMLSPGKLSAQSHSTSELLRTL